MSDDDSPSVDGWEIPEYLRNLYAMLVSFTDIYYNLDMTHQSAHATVEGFEHEGETFHPDPIMKALLDKNVELFDEEGNSTDSSFDELLVAGVNLAQLILIELTMRLEELDALPPGTEIGFDE